MSINLVSVLWQLKNLGDNLQLIKSFVHDEMSSLLRQLGKNEYNAAVKAFDNVRYSADPSSQVLLAIGHLQSSIEIFESAQEKEGSRFFSSYERRLDFIQNAVACYCLEITCYLYIGERELVQRKILTELRHITNVYQHWICVSYDDRSVRDPCRKELLAVKDFVNSKGFTHFYKRGVQAWQIWVGASITNWKEWNVDDF